MGMLIRLWNEQTDKEKEEFMRTMKLDMENINFWKTHKVVGDEEKGTSFIVDAIQDFDGEYVTGACTKIGNTSPGDCLSSELCPYCTDPPVRFLKGYDCYD